MTCACNTIRALRSTDEPTGLAGMSEHVGLAGTSERATWTTFDTAVKAVLRLEGGYVNHPRDPGGATNYGITQRTYDTWLRERGKPRRSVAQANITEARAIYYDNYWQPAGCWSLSPGMAVMHFDTAVNFGVGTAKQLLSQSGNTVAGYDAARRNRRQDIIARKPSMGVFRRGWKRRDDAILAAALDHAGTPGRTTPGRTTPGATAQRTTYKSPEWA